MNGKKKLRESMLFAWLDDDDEAIPHNHPSIEICIIWIKHLFLKLSVSKKVEKSKGVFISNATE